MKKMTILAVILALAVALTACGSKDVPETTAAESTVATTVAAPTETTAPQPVEITSWSMSASTWSSPNGATIHISATPSYYAEDCSVSFLVSIEGDEVANIPCEWNGSDYTASADLNAANGYCYYLVVTAADGTSTEVAVNTPAEPTNEAFVNLEAALESYCAVTIEESIFENNQLSLYGGNVQVQAPLITSDGADITCQEAVLVLTFNGETLDQKVLPLTQTETTGLYEALVDNVVFDIPEMEAEQTVELAVNAALSNGQLLTAFGGSWVCSEDGLMPILG